MYDGKTVSDASALKSARVLITGAEGFVGRHLTEALTSLGAECRLAVRSARPNDERVISIGDIGPATEWGRALDGIQLVVHLAARAHILRETAADPWEQFKRVNVDGTATLVAAAVDAGVRRFVYVSSIGVHGDSSKAGALTEKSPLEPISLYAKSKLAGEDAARSLAADKLELAIVRPPLVYGHGVKGNFLRLLRWIDKGWPIPVQTAGNQRSLVNVWDLCGFTARLLTHAAAPGRAWMISDGEDLSTADLVQRIAIAMSRKVRIVRMPRSLLSFAGAAAGRREQVRALCGSLTVDMSSTCGELGWRPMLSTTQALDRTVHWYLRACGERL